MIELNGKYTNAKIFAKTIESGVMSQVRRICNHPIFEDCPVAIMPDCHQGAGCTIGFTSPLPKNGEIIPNIIGVDQSCGMLTCKLRQEEFTEKDFKQLDSVIQEYIPIGFDGRASMHKDVSEYLKEEIKRYNKDCLNRDANADLNRVGSLGGGNHFISIEKGKTGTYLIIHSGSRNFGNAMAQYYQKIANEKNCYGEGIMKELSYLSGTDAEEYKECAKVCHQYAIESRHIMAKEICEKMGWEQFESIFETTHNYIGKDNIIRKGAISCEIGEKVLIPINMAYGSFIAFGKGNIEWNNSGPHGAGRILSRSKAKIQLSMEEYEESMKDVYSSCIRPSTIDESPMAYKDGEEIKEQIQQTADIYDHLKPIYNFKA